MRQNALRTSENYTSLEDDWLDEEEKENMNNQFVMGYFDYYWSKHGFMATFNKFFKKSLVTQTIYQTFYSIGMAIGLFAMSKWWLPRLCRHFKFEQLLEFNY